MASQDVNFDFTSRGADKLASDFKKTGDNAALAAKGARLCADALEKQRKAADVSAGATIALAKADKILEDAEHGLADGALEAEFALKKQADAAKKAAAESVAAGAAAGSAGGGFSALASPMGAAVAAGVALSPVIATLGIGLGGLGLAALGVAKNQKLMAAELAPLKSEFAGFTKALQPEVLGVFNTGIKIAGGLLHDIQPVAKATGTAFGGFLGQIDAEFKSRTWQDFFGFMAAQAGPDMKLLAGAILPLLDTLPKLLEDIQPIAVQFLQAAGGALKLADASVTLNEKIQHLGTQAGQSGGFLGRFADAGKKAVAQMLPGIPAAQALGKWLGIVGGSSDKAGKSTQAAGTAFAGAAPHAQSYAQQVAASAKATTALAAAQSAAVSTQLAYGNDILTSANDAQTFRDKLKASKDMIGLHTQAQRDSFGAANTYIGDLSRQASSAIASGHGTDAAIGAIRRGLPALDSAKTKNKQYWQEVRTLVGFLDKLRAEKAINEAIHVNGTGVWSVTPGKIGLPGGTAGGPFAYGGQVTGGTPGRDSVLIRAMPGEVVVPTNMVRAGAVDHLRGQLPGFASGGVVGSYGPGAVSGLPRWIAGETNATVSAVARSTAAAMVAGMKAAALTASHVPNVGSGVARWKGTVDQALRMEGLSTAFDSRVLYQMQTESGGNPNAINLTDINAQRGDPSRGLMQVIGSTFRAYHWPGTSGNIYDPLANIAAAINYARHVYGPQLGNQYGGIGSGKGYALGGLVPGYASGGTVSKQGAAWLRAWQTRHGAGAHGPVVVNEQIARLTAAEARAKALAGASGLSPGQHRFWASSAASEKKRLGVLHKELTTERSWRYQLSLNELGLDKEIRAAGNLPALAGPVKGWKAQLGRDKAKVAAISKMLGYSDAYLAAHKPAPKPPKVTPPGVPGSIPHTGGYTDNTADLIAQLFASLASNSRVVTLDSGGWLMPGVQAVANKTGRPEQVLAPGRGGGYGGGTVVLQNHGVIGSQAQLEDWLVRSMDNLKRKRRI